MDDSPSLVKEGKPARRILWMSSVLLLLPLGLAATPGPGQLEKTFATTPNPQISFSNLRGQIMVRGLDKLQVHATCTIVSPRVEMDTEALPRTGPAERIRFTAHVLDPLVTGSDETIDCALEVPLGASLEVRNQQGSVKIEKLQGHTWVESAGGRIAAADVAGHLTARSLGGDIEIIRPSGHVVEAFSINGALRFEAPTSRRLRGNTNSGKITYHGDFVLGADYVLSTYSGDIEVFCPPSASFELKAKTVKGKLDNTVRLTPTRRPVTPLYSASSLLGTHNTGSATVELTSFSGTIRIREQP